MTHTDHAPRTGAPGADEVSESDPSRPSSARWVALTVGVVMLALVGVLATRDPATTRVAKSPLVGRAAPPIAGATVDGDSFDLGDLQGRFVVVNYFATWCVPCQREHPELVEFSDRQRAEVVSVVFDDKAEAVADFFAREGGDWPVVADDGRIALSYGVAGIPESFLVNPDGVIVAKITGGVTADGLDALIAEAALLAEATNT
jgi:cytochrome c biogenesis protein CcmG/thiol:disulfide interchange protein DsbE